MLQEVSEPPRSHFSSLSSSPYVFLTSFKKLVIMADYIICNFFFFVSFDACASSAYVKGLDDIEW